MEYIRAAGKDSVYNLLLEFSEVFPHLEEKITNMDEYAEKLSEFACVYTAKKDDDNVGVLVFYANDMKTKNAYISLIGVKKDYEGMGFGKELLTFCEQISQKNGMCILKLEVDEDNTRAIRFYEKNGFVFVSETDHDSFYMQKDI